MFKEKYKNMNIEIKPSEEIINNTIENVKFIKNEKNIENNKNRNRVFKPIVVGCCIVCGSVVALPVLAKTVKNIYELMYLAPEEVAEPFTPVELSITKNNIKMEVVAIDIYDNIAKIYITLEDLQGNIFDEKIQLGSYTIDGIGNAVLGSEFYAYEKELNKATFMITIEGFENDNILESISDDIKFTVHDISVVSGELNDVHFKIPIDLENEIAPNLGSKDIYFSGGSGDIEKYLTPTMEIIGTSEDGNKIAKTLPVQGLIPNIEPINVGVKGINITGVVYENDMLYIQYGMDMKKDVFGNSGYIYLQKNDEKSHCLYSFSGVEDENAHRNLLDEYVQYGQYVFDILRDEISNYDLYGHFRFEEESIKGDWSIEFNLQT